MPQISYLDARADSTTGVDYLTGLSREAVAPMRCRLLAVRHLLRTKSRNNVLRCATGRKAPRQQGCIARIGTLHAEFNTRQQSGFCRCHPFFCRLQCHLADLDALTLLVSQVKQRLKTHLLLCAHRHTAFCPDHHRDSQSTKILVIVHQYVKRFLTIHYSSNKSFPRKYE